MATKSDHRHLHSADMMRPFPKQSYASSNSDRPLSDLINLPPLSSKQRAVRPISDIVQAAHIYRNSISSEAEAIDNWYENIQHYEHTVEAMATSKLDPKFKDDLNRVNEWFRLLCEAERTTALYSIVQHATQVQIRFLIAVLTKMANQDPLGALLSPASSQDKDPFMPNSAKQSELEAQQRLRSIYPMRNKLASRNMYRQSNAFSEPDEFSRRRQNDLLSGRILGLSDSGILYEKAMALKSAAVGSNSMSSVLNPSYLKSNGPPPPVKRPDSTSYLSSASPAGSPSSINIGNDWPFTLPKTDSSPGATVSARSSLADSSSTNSTLGGHSSSSEGLTEWSPLLAPKKHLQDQTLDRLDRPTIYDSKWAPAGTRLDNTNEQDTNCIPKPMLSSLDTMHSSLFNNTQQKHRRISEELISMNMPEEPRPTSSMLSDYNDSTSFLETDPKSRPKLPPILPVKYTRRMSNSTPTGHRYSPLLSPLPSPKPHSRTSNRSTSPPFRAWPPSPAGNTKTNYAQFLNPHDGINIPEYASDHSDGSVESHNETGHLTEAAMNRRRRASAARAAKDKIAAETVDFELMADVQAWLRTLRLHKYAYAFDGLTWQQVVRMDDEAMEKAGVNTIGARRKLLKVFENVMNHCDDNGIDY
ncbi:hypothetical protein VKS41_006772 [Umbelopsis sp. WA50703]